MTSSDGALLRLGSVEELLSAQWDSLLHEGDFFASTTWLRVAEATNRLPVVYLLLRAANSPRPVAGLPCFLVNHQTPLAFSRIDKVLQRLRSQRADAGGEDVVGPALMPSLVCGGRPGNTRLLRSRRVASGVEDVRRLIASAEEVAAELQAKSICFLYVEANDRFLRRALRAEGFDEFFHTHRCMLDISWPSFNGYLASFSSDRRSKIRRELKKLADANVETEMTHLTEDLLPILARLELNVVRKYGGLQPLARLEQVLRNHFVHLKGDALVALAKRRGRICGFAALTRWRDELYGGPVGFDYTLQGKLPVYFAVGFYEPINYAIEHRIRTIDLSIESFDAKVRRGCRTTPLYGYVKCPGPMKANLRRILEDLKDEVPSRQREMA